MRWPKARQGALAALALLIAGRAPGTLAPDIRGFVADARLGHPDQVRGVAATAGMNLRLVLAARRLIPRGSAYAIVFAGRWTPGRERGAVPKQREAGEAWTQFTLAPRLAVPASDASWLLVRGASPASLGIRAARVWRFGDDWLVQVA
jgi:hypothetical protein